LSAENVISRDRVDELLREVFREIQMMGGRARPKALFARLTSRLHLTAYELEQTPAAGVRWENTIRWYSVDCSKVGYLEKSGGYWSLTVLGEKALDLPPGQLVRNAQQAYRAWRSQQQAPETESVEMPASQEKVARQGYHVPYVASPGPDGGVDLVAYRDPLGTSAPRIRVQVKHRQAKVGAKDVRELEGLLRRDDDIGLLVSSGGFSADAERESRASRKHIELMDLDRLISLWQGHYASLREVGRAMLRLVTVSFLAPEEE
jgi:restriction system protein